MDKLELMHTLLGHLEADVQVDFGDVLLDVQDMHYSADREAIVLLLHPDDVQDVLRCPCRRKRADRQAKPRPIPPTDS